MNHLACSGPHVVQVVLDSRLWHRSLPNLSSLPRRAWMPQFSATAICRLCDDEPIALAVPLGALKMWETSSSQELLGAWR